MTHVLSPSQLEVFKLCPRKWGFQYLQGRKPPPHESAQAGTKIHDILERYLRDGTAIDESEVWGKYKIGAVAKAMAEFLPPAGSVAQTETEFEFEVDGAKYRGKIDGKIPGTIFDHKSTSDFRYIKDEETLETDLQALIYGRWADEDTTLQWTFGRTKGAVKAQPVRLHVLRDDVRERFDRVVTPLARQVLAEYDKNDPKSLVRNKDACHLYPPKGCPFKNECWTVGERLRNSMTKPERLVDKIKREKAEAEAAAAALVQAAPTEDPINPPLVTNTGAPAEPEVLAQTAVLPRKARKKKADTVQEILEEHGVELEVAPQRELKDGEGGVAPLARVVPLKEEDLDIKPIRILYLNAIPLKPSPDLVYAHNLIAKAAETVCNDMEIPHAKLAPYGTGGAALAAQLVADVKALVPGFDLVLFAKNPEGRDVEQSLVALAETVIMGV